MPKIPNTTVRTDHCLSIHVGSGDAIGYIQEWQPAQGRTVTPVYELNSASPGEIIENVPGNIQGLTVTVNRFDLFKSKMEEIWEPGNNGWDMLLDQSAGLTILETWKNPDGTVEVYVYDDCWFTSLGRSQSATGERIVRANASLMYKRRYKAQ